MSGDRTLRVTRTGGFAGLRSTAEIDLDGDDPRAPQARALIGGLDLDRVQRKQTATQPDRFVYELELPGEGRRTRVAEQDLTDDLRRLTALMLEGPGA